MSYSQTILEYLREVKDWVPSYLLGKRELCGKWVGSRGERSARDLAEEIDPKVERKIGRQLLAEGITFDFENKKIVPKYAYYKAKPPVKRIEYRVGGELINTKLFY